MANINKIKTDSQKEIQGVWTDFAEGIRLKIARARNPAYKKSIRDLTEPHQIKEIREDKLMLEDLDELLKQVRAKTILLGWENIEDEAGKPIEYSPEQALAFFNDPELHDFYTFVILTSENMELFKKELVKDAEKNLSTSSNGKSTGDDTKVS